MRARRLIPVIITSVVVLASCSGDDTSNDSSDTTETTAGPTTTAGEATSTTLPDPCLAVDPDDLTALFPGTTPIAPVTSPTSCRWPVSAEGLTGTFELSMQQVNEGIDDVVAARAPSGAAPIELSGLGERAVYVPTLVVFELDGATYTVEAVYDGDGVERPGESTISETLQRTAAAWAATL